MSVKSLAIRLLLPALLANGEAALAETLRAVDVLTPTNTDWRAFARAQGTVRKGGNVDFVLPSNPGSSYADIRRALWLAGLHGLANQTSPDPQTRRVMKDELALLRQRLKTPFAFDIAIRDVPGADRLLSLLVVSQAACTLIGGDEPTEVPTILRCRGDEVRNEKTEVDYTSLSLAVAIAKASHADRGLVFENDGSIATNVFVRRFSDRTVTVVNLADVTRRDLLYRQGQRRIAFDLHPAGIIHLRFAEPERLTRTCAELFATGLWQLDFDDPKFRARLVRAEILPTSVDENYMGRVRYRTTVCAPAGVEALLLHLETAGSETEVLFGGVSCGTRAWEPFEWPIPPECRGKNVPLEIRVEKRTYDGFLQTAPVWYHR